MKHKVNDVNGMRPSSWISLDHDFINFFFGGNLSTNKREHHVHFALADRSISVQVESLELESAGNFRRRGIQHSFLHNRERLRLPSLPPLRVQVAVFEIPAKLQNY